MFYEEAEHKKCTTKSIFWSMVAAAPCDQPTANTSCQNALLHCIKQNSIWMQWKKDREGESEYEKKKMMKQDKTKHTNTKRDG